jgi:hypothetical protein
MPCGARFTGIAFLILDGKADKTKISVDEDAYLRLAGSAYLPPVDATA